jgi:predicted O-methyltransferase YrrM
VPELYQQTEEEREMRQQKLQRKGVMALVAADKYAEAMHKFNTLVRQDERAQVVMLPLRDGLSIIRRVR